MNPLIAFVLFFFYCASATVAQQVLELRGSTAHILNQGLNEQRV
ncbi:MAG TPA: hypothetical protein VF553_07530 [Pyrinomonadaceae bacterium]|jgi:hypothetical protein